MMGWKDKLSEKELKRRHTTYLDTRCYQRVISDNKDLQLLRRVPCECEDLQS